MPRRGLLLVVVLIAAACHKNSGDPFDTTGSSKPPSANAQVIFASGSWATDTGQPRELLALDKDGTIERLTSCASAPQPCEVLQFSFSPDTTRAAVVRSQVNGDPAASTLYFMDLSRSVEKLLFPSQRVSFVDWSPDGSFLLYTSPGSQQTDVEDLYLSAPDGTNNQNLTQTTDIRERNGRIDPLGQSAVYELIDQTGVGRIYLFQNTPLTSGPATGPPLPGTLYVVGCDADPAFSPDSASIAFRRLTGIGNGGLGTWDLMTMKADGTAQQVILTGGGVYRGAPDWGQTGIVFVETDAGAGLSRLVVVQPDGSGRQVLREEPAAFGMMSPRWAAGN
ncbi:MAG TPA: hypothetical protein VMX54_16785 [Vicinamibacteria bacterium]|nr:hypothetical protein [Vicinamibacteria bacterium]